MSAPTETVRMYSVKTAAEILDTSPAYVFDRIKDGSIPRHIDLGSTRAKFRIRADDLQAFIDSRTVR